MKTLDELKILRESARQRMSMRSVKDGFRIQIGMGTCGIAAGARPIMNAFYEEIAAHGLSNVTIVQVGCMGNCALEPMVEIIDSHGKSHTYVSLKVSMVKEIVDMHLIQNQPIRKYILADRKEL